MTDITFFETLKEYGCSILENEPMSKHTTFKIGGEAEALVTVYNVEQLKKVIAFLSENDVKYMIVGKGSNLLVSDNGIKGVVIILDGDFKKVVADGCSIRCGAGVTLAKLCTLALEHGLGGLEFAFGIPGSVGGAVFMNAGAYGGEMKDVVVKCTHLTPDGELGEFTADKLDLSYRHSIYKENGCIILFAEFLLIPSSKEDIKGKMDDYMNRRKTKQPLEYPSAGSVFKRPEGNYAGALIEQCGLKGYRVGGAQVSEKHSGFIINTGNATCDDVLNLVKYIQNTVHMETGYRLEREIILV